MFHLAGLFHLILGPIVSSCYVMTTEGGETDHTRATGDGSAGGKTAPGELCLHIEKGLIQQAKGKQYKLQMLPN